MMAIIKSVLVIFFILISSNAFAANLAVSPSGSGNGSGSDWNNTINWGSITFVRGNTYYLMDGTYSSKQYSTANSGSSTITIKKATASDYGGLANWQSSYGDGQANIGSLTLISNYWVFDGATRNESNWLDGSSYGFRITDIATHSLNFGNASDNITIRYCDIGGAYSLSYSGSIPSYGIYFGGFGQTCDNWLISRNFIHNVGLVGQMAGVNSIIWEYNWLGLNWSKEIVRGQLQATNVTFRYNILKDGCRNDGSGGEPCTAEIALFGNQGDTPNFANFAAYGNLIWKTIGSWNADGCIMIESDSGGVIYNNTIVNNGTGAAKLAVNFASGSAIRNNIWYLTGGMTTGCEAAICDNNSVYTSSPPFVNASAGNFNLSSPLAGVSLGSTYNLDINGVTRGADGVWDRGAYEYTSGGGDYTAPVVTITSPTSGSTYSTSSSTIDISGTATDAVGVVSVTWSNDRGGSGTCTGTTSWSQSNITLLPGANVLTIRGYDAAGNSSTDTLTVTYIGTDTIPAQFTFTDIGNAARSTVYTSNTITVTGLDATATVSITGGTYSKNGGVYTSSAGTAFYGDTFAVRHTSSSSYATATNTVLTIGGVSDTYTTTTLVDPGDVIAPVCTITSPTSNSTYATATGTINLAGTASDAVGVVSVSWANDRGGSGTATGTTSWSKTGITLYPGVNVLTITARDAADNAGVDTLTVTYTPADSVAPVITITNPTSSATYETSSSTINLSGTASDAVGVVSVSWTNDRGGVGTCTGTTSWSQANIVLYSGVNILTVTARDAANNAGTDILTVTYTPVAGGSPTTIKGVYLKGVRR